MRSVAVWAFKRHFIVRLNKDCWGLQVSDEMFLCLVWVWCVLNSSWSLWGFDVQLCVLFENWLPLSLLCLFSPVLSAYFVYGTFWGFWAFMFGCGCVWILRYELSVIGQDSAWNAPSLSRNVGITPWEAQRSRWVARVARHRNCYVWGHVLRQSLNLRYPYPMTQVLLKVTNCPS